MCTDVCFVIRSDTFRHRAIEITVLNGRTGATLGKKQTNSHSNTDGGSISACRGGCLKLAACYAPRTFADRYKPRR